MPHHAVEALITFQHQNAPQVFPDQHRRQRFAVILNLAACAFAAHLGCCGTVITRRTRPLPQPAGGDKRSPQTTFPFKFMYPKFLGQAFATFQVFLWHYVVPKEYEHSDARQVHVFRERIAESLSRSDAARAVDWPNFAAHGERQEASRENTAKILAEWSCKHLFT